MKMLRGLRKFDLDHCDLPTMLWNVAVVLRVLTLNIDTTYHKAIPKYRYIITLLSVVCYLYVYLVSMVWFVSVRSPQTGDLVAAMVVFSLGISSEIGNLKMINMFVYIDKIRKIADDFLECDAQTIKGSRFQNNLLKSSRVVKKRAIIYWMVLMINGVLYILKPVLMPGKNLPENYFIIYGLEPMFETPNYEIAFTMMAVGVLYICYVPASVTAYLIIIAGYTESQMLALSEEMVNIWPDAIKKAEEEHKTYIFNKYAAKNKMVINKHIEKRLKEIMAHHAMIINLFRDVEDVFKGSIVIGFLLLVLGLIAELLGKLENTYLQTPFSLVQVGMDCFIGQRVMDASEIFEQAVYDSQWENFDKCNQKMVLVMVQNSQKNMTLSAGGMATLNFRSLMTILRGIYSAYTALRLQLSVHIMWQELRKFGLGHCDLPTMLWNVAVGLRVVTLNIDTKYDKGIPIYYYILTVVTAACYIYVFLLCMVWFVFIRCPQTGDLVAAMVVFSLGISSCIGIVKLVYMFVYVDKIRNITDDFLECDAQTIPNSRFQTNLLTSLRAVKKRALMYCMVISCNGILYLLMPIAIPGKNLPENNIVIYGLEPMFESPHYEIAYTMMSAGVWFICLICSCVTSYLIVIVGYIESQMLALSKEMLCLWPDAVEKAKLALEATNIDVKEANSRILINNIVESHLKELIIHHASVIKLYNKVKEVFKGAIAMGFVFLVGGLIAELLGKLENTYLQLPFAFMQVAVDCFTGQRVMDASLIFQQAVYDCRWENFDKNNMKLVLVILQNAQKTMQLSAGGLAKLSLSCLMTITRGIYSTYTALRSTF